MSGQDGGKVDTATPQPVDTTTTPDPDKSLRTGVMGKLKADMIFLERITTNPALTRNYLDPKFRKNKVIIAAANDGLSFLKVRSSFWETSGPGGKPEANFWETSDVGALTWGSPLTGTPWGE